MIAVLWRATGGRHVFFAEWTRPGRRWRVRLAALAAMAMLSAAHATPFDPEAARNVAPVIAPAPAPVFAANVDLNIPPQPVLARPSHATPSELPDIPMRDSAPGWIITTVRRFDAPRFRTPTSFHAPAMRDAGPSPALEAPAAPLFPDYAKRLIPLDRIIAPPAADDPIDPAEADTPPLLANPPRPPRPGALRDALIIEGDARSGALSLDAQSDPDRANAPTRLAPRRARAPAPRPDRPARRNARLGASQQNGQGPNDRRPNDQRPNDPRPNDPRPMENVAPEISRETAPNPNLADLPQVILDAIAQRNRPSPRAAAAQEAAPPRIRAARMASSTGNSWRFAVDPVGWAAAAHWRTGRRSSPDLVGLYCSHPRIEPEHYVRAGLRPPEGPFRGSFVLRIGARFYLRTNGLRSGELRGDGRPYWLRVQIRDRRNGDIDQLVAGHADRAQNWFDVTVPMADPLLTALRDGVSLSVSEEASGATRRYPLRGSRRAIEQLLGFCSGRLPTGAMAPR